MKRENTAKIKNAVRAVAFLLCAGLMFSGLTSLSVNHRTYTLGTECEWLTSSYLYGLEPHSIEVVALGSSAVRDSFSPNELFHEHGIASINIGMGSASLFSHYYTLIDMCKTNKPKVLLLEPCDLFREYSFSPARHYRARLDVMKISFNKITAINDMIFQEDSKLSYVFPLSALHTNWKMFDEAGMNIKSPYEPDVTTFRLGQNLQYSTYTPTSKFAEFSGFESTGKDKELICGEAYIYFEKIVEYCEENDIDLVLYTTPKNIETVAHYNTVSELAKKHNLPYINFMTEQSYRETGLDFTTDLYNAQHHNVYGAQKITRYLGSFLADNYDLSDKRGNPDYAFYDEFYEYYQRDMFFGTLGQITSMSDYLDMLTGSSMSNFTVFFSVKDDCQTSIGDELADKLRAMGFQSENVFKEYGYSFIGIWRDGKILYEACSETIDNPETDILTHKGVLSDGYKYYVESAANQVGNNSSIVINGSEYSKNLRGFNVVVYDDFTGRVVDSICWDTYRDAGVAFKR